MRAQKLRSKDPKASQTVQTKNSNTMLTGHNLNHVLSLAVLNDMVYYLLVFGMILATMTMMESFVSSVLSRNHWEWQEIRFSGSTVSCVVCGYIPTVLFRKNTISQKYLCKECSS